MPQTRSSEFLQYFRQIEEFLEKNDSQKNSNSSKYSFSDRVDRSRLLRKPEKEKLKSYARLRNSIVHNPYRGGRPIAEPHETTVDDIKHIHFLLTKPPLLTDVLKDFPKPTILSSTDNFDVFLGLVKKFDFSQSPVRTDSGYKLITTNALARWYANVFETEEGILEHPQIREVLEFCESSDRVETVNPGTTALQALEILNGEVQKSEPPTALLVLGRPNDPPQAICSQADLPLLYRSREP